MRPTVALIIVIACALAACANTGRSRLGYAPPADQPAQPGMGYVGSVGADLIWTQVLDRLTQSGLKIDLTDPDRGIMVATYSGDPTPYVTCGWILLYGPGEPERIDASGEASFRRVIGGRSVQIGRDLKLDARLVVQIKPDQGDAFVEASSTYVLTKTVVAADRSGRRRGRNYEIVSFSTGERAEFSKGTVCQPNGALERTVLDILPPATRVAQRTQLTSPVPTRQATIAETEIASNDLRQRSSSSGEVQEQAVAVDDVRQQAPPGDDLQQQSSASDDVGQQVAKSDNAQEPFPAISDLQQQARASKDVGQQVAARSGLEARPVECTISDKVFCAVLEITDPYRRANEEGGLGLQVGQIEGGNPLLDSNGPGLDISLPRYDAYLAVSYFLRDGTVHHVRAGSSQRWPANAREFVGDPGLSADQSESVQMVVAVASDVPLFSSARPPSEATDTYLAELRSRLTELTDGNPPPRIAASLVVIMPAKRDSS